MKPEKDFVHLDIRTARTPGAFGSPEEYTQKGHEMGIERLGVADRDISTWVNWERECHENGIHPLFGLEASFTTPLDRRPHRATVLVQDTRGFNSVTRLAEKGARASIEDLQRHKDGVVIIAPEFSYGPLREVVDNKQLFLETTPHESANKHLVQQQAKQAKAGQVELVGSNRVWTPEDKRFNTLLSVILQAHAMKTKLPRDLLVANGGLLSFADNKKTFQQLTELLEGTKLGLYLSDFHPKGTLQTPQRMRTVFSEIPGAIENSAAIAESCLPKSLPDITLPKYPVPEGKNIFDLLEERCRAGLSERFDTVTAEIKDRLEYELRVIRDRGLVDHFLIVGDVADFCRKHDISSFGIGSATGSLVSYVLGITSVNPVANDLLFERFLGPKSAGRIPDIDFVTDAERRDEIFEHIRTTYPDRGMYPYRIAIFPTYQIDGALRALLTVFDYKNKEIEQIQRTIHKGKALSPELGQINHLAQNLTDKNHVTEIVQTHPSKVVFAAEPITKGYATRTRQEFPLVEIDKNRAETTMNVDEVSKNGITLLNHVLEKLHKEKKDLPRDDQETLRTVFRGETLGIAEIETEWMQSVLTQYGKAAIAGSRFPLSLEGRGQGEGEHVRNKFTEMDMVHAFAVSRPGTRKTMETYFRRMSGEEEVTYDHPSMEKILSETLGVIVYQEQAMGVVKQVANFSDDEAEVLRRAMSKERSQNVMHSIEAKFVAGAKQNGLTELQAQRIYGQIAEFTRYSFLKGHAMTLVNEVIYPAAYLKTHHPKEYFQELFMLGKNFYFMIGRGDIYEAEARRLGLF